MVGAGTGEALPGPGACEVLVFREAVGAYKRWSVKSRPAGWVAEGLVVPLEPYGQQNRR
jgi:hypothetical protein